jgi:hypothetical protein
MLHTLSGMAEDWYIPPSPLLLPPALPPPTAATATTQNDHRKCMNRVYEEKENGLLFKQCQAEEMECCFL